MSTKSLRNALHALVIADARLKSLADLARSELEAIEQLARTLTNDEDCKPLHHEDRTYEAALLARIAKEAP